jgi:hypothetical protein
MVASANTATLFAENQLACLMFHRFSEPSIDLIPRRVCYFGRATPAVLFPQAANIFDHELGEGGLPPGSNALLKIGRGSPRTDIASAGWKCL